MLFVALVVLSLLLLVAIRAWFENWPASSPSYRTEESPPTEAPSP